MNLLRSIVMAFQMFSRVPMPRVEWKKENMHYVFAAFPLLGVCIGLLLWGWAALSAWLGLGTLLYATGLTLIPALFSGGIHLDGFCDTADALASHAEPEKKRAILKDPHAGAFAVIALGLYLLAYLGLSSELPRSGPVLYLLCLVPVLSRIGAAFAGISFPVSSQTGLQHTFNDSAKKRVVLFLLLLWLLATTSLMVIHQPYLAAVLLLVAVVTAVYVYVMSRKAFGGMSGDLTGFMLQLSELLMLAVLVFLQKGIG